MLKRFLHALLGWRLTFVVGAWSFAVAVQCLFCRDYRSAGFSLLMSLVWLWCGYEDLSRSLRQEGKTLPSFISRRAANPAKEKPELFTKADPNQNRRTRRW